MKISVEKSSQEMLREIKEISGQKVLECYQCGKCTAACPAVEFMDVLPHQLLRFLQLGSLEEVWHCKTIWVCASCFSCAGRCPRDVDLPAIMEAVRVILLRGKGGARLKVEDLAPALRRGMPVQGIVGAFRKYVR